MPARTKTALHFVPHARPKQTPARIRQGRSSNPRTGPRATRPRPGDVSKRVAIFKRPQSRSATRQWVAQSSQNARKMSSSANRDITKWRPSKPSSSPATHPNIVEPVSRRISLHITSTIKVPVTAAEKRQPKGVSPKIHSPNAIIHLPTSGWTTMFGSSPKMPLVDPELMIALASLTLGVFGLSTNVIA